MTVIQWVRHARTSQATHFNFVFGAPAQCSSSLEATMRHAFLEFFACRGTYTRNSGRACPYDAAHHISLLTPMGQRYAC